MLQWLFYVFVVTMLLAGAAWLLERALRGRHWRTRWVWVTAVGLAVRSASEMVGDVDRCTALGCERLNADPRAATRIDGIPVIRECSLH